MDVMLKHASTALASSLVGGLGGSSRAASLVAIFQQIEKHPVFVGALLRPRSQTSDIAMWASMDMKGLSLRAYWALWREGSVLVVVTIAPGRTM